MTLTATATVYKVTTDDGMIEYVEAINPFQIRGFYRKENLGRIVRLEIAK